MNEMIESMLGEEEQNELDIVVSLGQIPKRFDVIFGAWNISLADAVCSGDDGWLIDKAGWNIRIVVELQNEQACLTYYACHQLTSDRHGRLYADGRMERLPLLDAAAG